MAANPSFHSCFAGLDVTQGPPIHHNGKRAPLGYLGLTGMEMSSALAPRHWTAFGIHCSAGELQPGGRTRLPSQEAGRDAFGAARTYLQGAHTGKPEKIEQSLFTSYGQNQPVSLGAQRATHVPPFCSHPKQNTCTAHRRLRSAFPFRLLNLPRVFCSAFFL